MLLLMLFFVALYCCIVEFGDIGWAGNLIFFSYLFSLLFSYCRCFASSPCHLVPPLAALHCLTLTLITTYHKHSRVRLIRKQLKYHVP
jgi:hypothetical protein